MTWIGNNCSITKKHLFGKAFPILSQAEESAADVLDNKIHPYLM